MKLVIGVLTGLSITVLFLTAPQNISAREWTQDAGNAQRTGYTQEEPAEPWTFQWSWNGADSNGGTGGHFYDAPKEARTVMGSGKLFVPAGSRGLYALHLQNGSQAWNFTATSVVASPSYDPLTNSIFVGGMDGKVYKLHPETGSIIKTYDAGNPISKALLIHNSAVYLVTNSGGLIKIDANTLEPVWSTAYTSGSTIATSPAYSETRNLIVFATDDLYVHAVNAQDGTRKWRVKPSPNTPSGTGQPTAGGAFLGNQFDLGWPVIAEQHGVVFVRMQLPHQAHFEGPNSGRFASTNAENRAWLQQNPQLKNLFALNLDNGTEKFIPAVGYGSTEDLVIGTSTTNGVMGSMPVVKTLPDGKEVAYIHFRSNQTNPASDFRWSGHMGEMVLDDTTVPGLQAGDLRFVKMSKYQSSPAKGNCDVHIIDEQTPLTMAGETLINAHWASSCSVRITDRSNSRGIQISNPIETTPRPLVIRAQRASCSDKNITTRFTSCNAQYVTDGGGSGNGRFFGGSTFWSYWGVPDPPGWSVGSGNTAGNSYSAGFQARYTYVSQGYVVVQGNGGDIMVLKHSGAVSNPSPTPGPSTCHNIDINQDKVIDLSDYSILVANFLRMPLLNPRADINSDGVADLTDYSMLVATFLQSCE